uniref:ParB N-terminal domain-containing protein n=1 Tax=Phenylobacterium glaciei TaxID=2803784 RepID=A0A974P4Z4_9CAUL|nr:ParB N-terminal domain-containing protein [Phenylobacterium glaciei]
MRASILSRGFVDAITVDPDNTIIDGQCRFEIAQELGLAKIPVIRIAHLSPAEIRVYRLAANKLAMESGWHEDLLPAELQSLENLQLNTPLELTGFDGAELDSLLEHKPAPKDEQDNRIPEGQGPIVTRSGDVFLLGVHKLHCGDACDVSSYEMLMGDERARMVFADPPTTLPSTAT